VTTADDAAATIVAKLTAAGIRATTDPGALNPPVVLVVPVPRRQYNVGCGYTATWTLHALAGAPTRGDRTIGAQLNELVDAVASTFPVESATPGAYVVGSNTHDSSTITFSEVLTQ